MTPGFQGVWSRVLIALIAISHSGGGVFAHSVDTIEPLPERGGFDYQLGGGYEPAADVVIVARDSTDEPDPDRYSICYVNGFQTQPGSAGHWLNLDVDVLLRDTEGIPVSDPGWPDEFILDPGTPAQRRAILSVLGPIIDECAASGFQAIEIDNFDTWTRFEQIERQSALALARLYVDRAHAAGLAIGQKNAAEVAAIGATVLGFDFAVAESCFVWSECDVYVEAYGDRVLDIEYIDELDVSIAELCASPDRAPRTIVRDHDLVPEGDPDHVFEQCPQ